MSRAASIRYSAKNVLNLPGWIVVSVKEKVPQLKVIMKAQDAKTHPTGQPIVHFEIIGKDPEKLRSYYKELFGWEFDTDAPVAQAVSETGNYGFIERNTTSDGTGIPGGIGGGLDYDSHVIFYVGVPEVEAALQKAESLGGTRRMGPEKNPGANLVVAHFTDPEGHLIGLAGPA
jgi:predicted enzyme related to lactoylglutathione lyase